MRRQSMLLALLALTCLMASAAHADGCPEGEAIPLSKPEKAFYEKFQQLRAALPKPEAGWQYDKNTQEMMAPDYKDYLPAYTCFVNNYYLDVSAGYTRPMSEADSAKEQQVIQGKPDPAKQKKLDDLMAQERALMPQLMAAAQKGDTKTMDALNKQTDALNKQMTQAQIDANSGKQGAMDTIEADRSATVSIGLNNPDSLDCYGDPKPVQVSGGTAFSCEHPITYSSPGNPLDKPEGRVVLIYGKSTQDKDDDWDRQDIEGKHTKDTAMIIRPQLDNPVALGVHNLTVVVSADNLARAQSLFKQLNLAALQKMIH
ncbi:MAG TPA: hypothetical protein VH327_01445 [Gammaproteobacteria bacterium]|jgi:hypothetical protein|nr:hypothetical protein [Gammaproteobacteria bacterium]